MSQKFYSEVQLEALNNATVDTNKFLVSDNSTVKYRTGTEVLSDIGAISSVTATSPITSTGGTTPVISTSMATNKLIGRSTAGTGVMEEITIGSGLALSGGTLSSSGSPSNILHGTAAGTDTYTVTIAGATAYADGDAYLVRFTNGNTTGATLNINSLGAIPLYRNNDGAVIGGDIWDGAEMLCIYNSTLTAFQCIGTSSNSLFAYVTNADSVAITKGQPVYAFGGTGDRLTVKRAFNTSDTGSARTIGVVLTSSIAVNQKGIIIIEGLLDGLSILPTSTWADGDTVYLGTTAGSITNVKQYAPNHLVYLGTVTTASNGSSGRWYVRVQNGYELDELHNVQAQTPSLKDTLWYDNTVSPAQWKTASIPTILGYTPANASGTTNYVSKFTGTTALGNSLIYDNGTNVGIGTTSPSVASGLGLVLNGQAGQTRLAFKNNYTGDTSSDGVQFALIGGTSAFVFQNRESDGYFSFETNGNEIFRTSGTNVGIGTSSPSQRLTVAGGRTLLDQLQYTRAIDISGANLNDYTSAGFYNGELMTNAPNSGWFWITVERYSNDANWVHQTATSFGANNTANIIYSRTNSGGTWTSWKTLTTSSDISGTTNYVSKFTGANSLGNSLIYDNGSGVGIGTTSPLFTTAGRSVLDVNGSSGSLISLSVGGVAGSYLYQVSNNLIITNDSYGDIITYTSGNERMRITSAGNIGIGTSSPQSALSIGSNHGTLVSIGNASWGSTAVLKTSWDGTDYTQLLVAGGSANSANITLRASGNVGIGTTSPSYKTTIASNPRNTDVLCVVSDQINADGAQSYVGISLQDQYANGGGNASAIRSYSNLYSQWGSTLTFSTTGTAGNGVLERMRITSAGNVGIGTTSPFYSLDLTGQVIRTARIYSASTDTRMYLQNTTSGNPTTDAGLMVGLIGNESYFFNYQAGNTIFGTSGTEKMRITSSGNVGIGTSSPGYKLQVNDPIATVASFGNFTALQTASGTGFRWTLNNDGTFRVQKTTDGFFNIDATPIIIDSSNNVGIGTTSPGAKLDVAGDALINGLTVGRGGGNSAFNTALGVGALSSNTSGEYNIAIGRSANTSNNISGSTVIGPDLFTNPSGVSGLTSNSIAISQYNPDFAGTQYPHFYAPDKIQCPNSGAVTDILSIDYGIYTAAFIEYSLFNSDGDQFRAGTYTIAFKSSGTPVDIDDQTVVYSGTTLLANFIGSQSGSVHTIQLRNDDSDTYNIRITARLLMR